ncbi:probable G-protein coupled receptor 33 [Ambystoma mexicanum]|uniref:probable G-protein coupled receptor 33 n=1 Tax=Ambystoma mexicanum TaxID=8296 RepID=UPI0037E81097
MDLGNQTHLSDNKTSTYGSSPTFQGFTLPTSMESVNFTHMDVISKFSTPSTTLESLNATYGDILISKGSALPTVLNAVTSTDGDFGSPSEHQTAILILLSVFLFATFAIGILGNSFYLCIMGCKMKQTASTVLIQQLTGAYLLFTLIIPLFAVFLLMDSRWIFGTTVCKLVTFVVSLSMFVSVFLLTVISVDRCVLVVYPHWTRSYRTTKWASLVSISVWVLALIFSSPYLAFPKTSVDANNKIVCFNDYAFSDDFVTPEIQQLRQTVHLSMFLFQLVVGFILPFSIMVTCYAKLTFQLKASSHNKTNKPFKVIAAAVISFFVCWLPYHVYRGLTVYQDSFDLMLLFVVRVVAIILCCVNASCTPILYLFIGDTFRDLFKKSIYSLFGSMFGDDPLHSNLIKENKCSESSTSCHSPVTNIFQLESPA